MKSRAPRIRKSKHGTLEEALDLLEASPLKTTKVRKAVLGVLVDRHGPFSAEEIYEFIKDGSLDKATVFRTVLSFERAGLVRRCELGDGVSRYEFQCEHEEHHHHITCKVCRKTEMITDCSLGRAEKAVRDQGYEKISHALEFFGVCKNCQGD